MAEQAFEQLKTQLHTAAAEFVGDAQALRDILMAMANDVERIFHEPMDIFPVAHHSPASALQLVRRLNERPPKVIYIELCEDLREVVTNLYDCKLPIALQAFASESDVIDPDTLPVTIVAPLTEASAEYQAIAYCLQHPETQLIFVDRAVDYIFQWKERDVAIPEPDEEAPEQEEATMHGSAIGVAMGSLVPTFDEFLNFMLRNSNCRHFSEWWEQYVDRAIIGSDYETYRQVMVLVGSLIRRIGRRAQDVEVDRLRERYMWTRMKQHLQAHNIAPEDALHICGAAHTASDVAEFGTHSDLIWQDIPTQSKTNWLYGLIPSSFAAIEYQFSHPAGTVSLAEGTWQKGLSASQTKPFTLSENVREKQKTKRLAITTSTERLAKADALFSFLTQPPAFAQEDTAQLVDWCARIVAMARNNGYLSSTADSIAIYETSFLLAGIRNRQHPTPYDFQDAAVTCLEKERTPGKRNIAHLCRILLGGDRTGVVGYESLPPLAKNIYDRLAPLGVNLYGQTNQRALMDFQKNPELRDCSELLWRLNYMLGNAVVQPIVGERKLGHTPIQESWEIRIGKHQREVIQLGYEGVTLEQVLEHRMKQRAYGDKTSAALAFSTGEASLLYLNSPRFTRELGNHARYLLEQEVSVTDAPDIFQRARRLVHYYRKLPTGIAEWLQNFVATGYSHYASLLPKALTDNGTKPDEIAGMLGFIFSLESLALSLGCSRSQLIISVEQAAQEQIVPDKMGLLWTAEWILNMRGISEIREMMCAIIYDGMRLPTLPQYLNGFILALTFAPRIGLFVVEMLSELFANLPDNLLIPWLPGLILQLRQQQGILQPLIKEASTVFPNTLDGFDNWQPQWLADVPQGKAAQVITPMSESEKAVRALQQSAPDTANALAQHFGVVDFTWREASMVTASLSEGEAAVQQLITSAPETMDVLGFLIK
jgi:hypothetical protein